MLGLIISAVAEIRSADKATPVFKGLKQDSEDALLEF
jgi:hypothetical protein